MVAKCDAMVVSGPDGENTARSRNQSDCRICRIPPAHERRKKQMEIFTKELSKVTPVNIPPTALPSGNYNDWHCRHGYS